MIPGRNTFLAFVTILAVLAAAAVLTAVLPGYTAWADPVASDARDRLEDLEEAREEAAVALMLAEGELSAAEEEIEEAKETRDRVEEQLETTRSSLEGQQAALTKARHRLNDRVRNMYKWGSFSWIDLLFKSETLGGIVQRVQALEAIVDRDADLVAEVQQAATRTRQTAEHLAELEQAKSAQIERLEQSRQRLEQARDRRAGVVAALGSEIDDVRVQIQATERRMAELNAQAGSPSRAQQDGDSSGDTEQEPTSSSESPSSSESSSSSESPGGASDGEPQGKKLTVKATAYALRGTTATGIPAGPGVIAVDPRVIPLGTRLYVPGYGEGIAADTGGAVKGNYIDVWLPTREEALEWGIKRLTITILD